MTTKVKNAPKNPDTININDELELEWWADHFGINKDKIKHAVNMVGPSVESVRRYLQK
jgi:hypothetical protein